MKAAGPALLAGIALAACNAKVTAAHDAERQLAIVKSSHGSKPEICDAAQAVATAWLKAEDQHRYEMAKVEANLACLEADMERYEQDHGG